MKRLLFAFLALFLAVPALAVTPTPGQWDTGPQSISYPVIGSNGVYTEHLGNGTTHGGLPPAFAWQMADIPAPVIDSRQINEAPGAGSFTAADNEAKFRFTLFPNHTLPDDPLKFHCQRGASHLHELMGPPKGGACSTFQQLRNDCNTDVGNGLIGSSNPGRNLNCSLYWHPDLIDRNPLSDGVDRIKKALQVPLYYQIDNGGCGTDNACLKARAATYVDFVMGIGYIGGKNFGDPWNLKQANAIKIANAANLAAGGSGIEYQANAFPDGFDGWVCYRPDGVVRDGPHDNVDDLTCSAGDTLVPILDFPLCWDGHNTYSPSGQDHVIPAIRVDAKDTVGGSVVTHTDVCPVGWFKIAQLEDKPQFILTKSISSSVANDGPYLSSDAAFQVAARAEACVGTGATQACPPAGYTTFVCKDGCSFHADYMQAWMKKYIRRASRHCLAIPWTDTSETGLDADQTTLTAEPCLFDTLSTDTGTDSALVQLATPPTTDVDGHDIHTFYPMPVPKGHMGPGTMHP